MRSTANERVLTILDEAINIESNVAELYMSFYKRFPEDREFWRKLSIEEINHAALLETGKDIFLPLKKFPMEMLPPSLEMLFESNKKILSTIPQYHHLISRESAFSIALEIEQYAGEVHFQEAMEKSPCSKILNMIQSINKEEKEYAKRIQTYMNEHQIILIKSSNPPAPELPNSNT